MSDLFAGWQQYPLDLLEPCEDIAFYRAELEERAASIFTTDVSSIRVETLQTVSSASNHRAVSNSVTLVAQPIQVPTPSAIVIPDLHCLERSLRDCVSSASDHFYFLCQNTTRSRIRMTFEMFCLLCHAFQVFPQFLNIVMAFGFKMKNTDEYFTSCYRQCSRDAHMVASPKVYTNYSLCYNVRYMDRHGRSGLVDPWSFRHTAIYQRYEFCQDRSICIFIQSPSAAQNSLGEMLQANQGSHSRSPLQAHLLILKVCARKWRWYFNYLSDDLRNMKDDVTWERINKPHSTVSFEQSQSLEVLRWKLREAQANLESNINIGNTILEHANDITETLRQQSPAALCHHSRLVSELVQYVSDLQIHRRKALGLLDSTMSIESLILKLLDLRNYDLSNRNAVSLKDLAEAGSIENHLMVAIAQHTSNDSRAMKIISFIAVAFLPATLISSIFSTDLISNSTTDKGKVPPKLILLYATLTTILTSITVAGVFLWTRKSQQLLKAGRSP